MRQTTRYRLVLAALVVAGAITFSVSPAGAQFASRVVEVTGLGGAPIPVTAGEGGVEVFGSIQAFPPDGGTQVTLAGERVDANITNEYVAVAGDSFGARVPIVGPVTFETPQEIVVTGIPVVGLEPGTIVGFTPETYSLLAGERECVDYGIGNVTVDGGVYTFISVPGQQTASITIHNCDVNVDYVSCFRGWLPDGGPPPSCAQGPGVANVPIHNGETWVVDGLANNQRLSCTACTHAGPPSGGTCLAGGTISICTPSP